jgi:hypothetical protein
MRPSGSQSLYSCGFQSNLPPGIRGDLMGFELNRSTEEKVI